MIARRLEYFEPHFLDEALVVLDRFAGAARALAGGTRLVPDLRAHQGDVVAIVNLKRIDDLHRIQPEGDALSVGALANAARLAAEPIVRGAAPLLARAALSMGAPQLRTIATVGGNICSGDPASDLTTALLALDAEVLIAKSGLGERRAALADILIPGGTTLRADEVLTRVVVPAQRASFAYHKMQTRRGFEMALVAVAVSLQVTGLRIERVRIAMAGSARICVRAVHAERYLVDAEKGAKAVAAAADAAADRDAEPTSDMRASADYRRNLVRVLTRRALHDALDSRA